MKIIFFGASELGYACCEALLKDCHKIEAIFTIPKQFKISYSPGKLVSNVLHKDFYELGRKYNLPVHAIEGKMMGHKNRIASYKPDLLLAIGWYYMIPEQIRKLAPKGCAGVHASLLPKYRGGAPLVWAVINGEKETGVSLFYFENGVDDGDIIAQKKFSIEPEEDIKDILGKATIASVKIVRKYVPMIAKGKELRKKQNEKQATFFPQRKPDDGIINWNWNPERIKNFIRAQTKPYPGAYTVRDKKKIIIWDADIIEFDKKNRLQK